MNNKIYEINYKRLVLLLLPTMLRKPLIAAVASAMASPITTLYNTFIKYRKDTNYRLNHNGQTCYLRAVLNDKFDTYSKRIVVSDEGIEGSAVIAYMREHNDFKLLDLRNAGAILLSRRGFSGSNCFDFMINIPSDMYGAIDEHRLRAVTNIYKLASKRYAINYV